jgi:hypothetical protein
MIFFFLKFDFGLYHVHVHIGCKMGCHAFQLLMRHPQLALFAHMMDYVQPLVDYVQYIIIKEMSAQSLVELDICFVKLCHEG